MTRIIGKTNRSGKVWPHGDYPLIEVGKLTLDRNPTDFHTQIEQAAFSPDSLSAT